jgi:hypothetical protein
MECIHSLFQGIQFGSHFIKLFYHHPTIHTSRSCVGIAGEVLEGTGNLSSYLLVEFSLTCDHHISLVAYLLLAETQQGTVPGKTEQLEQHPSSVLK